MTRTAERATGEGVLLDGLMPRMLISVVVGSLAVVQAFYKPFDAIGLALVGLAALPWLASILDVAELPGGLRLQFRRVQERQEELARQLCLIQATIQLMLSEYERQHLENLRNERFDVEIEPGGNFEWELRHLVTLGLVDRNQGKGLRMLFRNQGRVDVKEYLHITVRGKQYLDLIDAAAIAVPHG